MLGVTILSKDGKPVRAFVGGDSVNRAYKWACREYLYNAYPSELPRYLELKFNKMENRDFSKLIEDNYEANILASIRNHST